MAASTAGSSLPLRSRTPSCKSSWPDHRPSGAAALAARGGRGRPGRRAASLSMASPREESSRAGARSDVSSQALVLNRALEGSSGGENGRKDAHLLPSTESAPSPLSIFIVCFDYGCKRASFVLLLILCSSIGPLSSVQSSNPSSGGSRLRVAYQVRYSSARR